MLQTLKSARESSLASVAGSCTNSAQFRQLVNKGTQMLMRRGDWPGLVIPIYTCVKRGCVVFPRYVGNVRQINLCKRPVEIRNLWYEFQTHTGWRDCYSSGWFQQQSRFSQQGKTPVYQNVLGEGRLVRACIQVQADVGKTVTIFGEDNNGQTIRTKNSDGTWSDGVILNLAMPFASTNFFVRRIDRVLKDETESDVRLYGYDAANNVLEDITLMEPSETNPSLARYQINGCVGSDCGSSKSATALVKLAFVPVRFDTDLVLISNLDALEAMCQSIKSRQAGDFASADASESFAFRELNYSTGDEFPLDQVAVNIEPAAFFMGQRGF